MNSDAAPAPGQSVHGRCYSEVYDLLYGDKDYAREARYVASLLEKQGCGRGGRLLEVACGTGEHALALQALGYEVCATDASEHMIARARRKAVDLGSGASFAVTDMRELEGLGPFDGAVCLFDSMGFLESDVEISRCLAAIRRVLRPGGALVFDFLHATTFARKFERVRVRRWSGSGGRVIRISETDLDPATMVCAVRFTVFRRRGDGAWDAFEETHRNRCLDVEDAARLLARAGYVDVEWSGAYEAVPVTEESWHVVVAARRTGSSGP